MFITNFYYINNSVIFITQISHLFYHTNNSSLLCIEFYVNDILHLCMWGKLFSGACVSDSPSLRIMKGGEREFRETCCDTLTFTYSVANRRVAGIHPRVLVRCQRQVSSNRRRSSQQNHLADKIISVLGWHISSDLRTFYWYWVSKFISW